jgi:PHD/YefM family antitoxin component YafN of YafNO toxin-antitoxin module
MATRDIRSKFASVIEDVSFRGKRVIVTSNERDRCALVSMEDLAKLEAIEVRAAKRRK